MIIYTLLIALHKVYAALQIMNSHAQNMYYSLLVNCHNIGVCQEYHISVKTLPGNARSSGISVSIKCFSFFSRLKSVIDT
jgi:hypothetical protein